MRGNHVGKRSMRNGFPARDLSWEDVHIDGFGTMTICRYCGNAIEVGHAASCPVCNRKQH
jgi:rubrerythrin